MMVRCELFFYFCFLIQFCVRLLVHLWNNVAVYFISTLLLSSSDRAPVAHAGLSAQPGPSRASWPNRAVSCWTSVPRTWWTVSKKMTAVEEDTWPTPLGTSRKTEASTRGRHIPMWERWDHDVPVSYIWKTNAVKWQTLSPGNSK